MVLTTIRTARADEVGEIAALLLAAFESYRPLYTPEGFLRTTPDASLLAARFNDGPVWVALQGERIVGTLAAVVRGDVLYLRSMAVLPLARGSGIGRDLLDEATKFAQDRRCSMLTLSTTPFLERAIALYESCGFRHTGHADLGGTPLWEMQKAVPSKA